MYSRFLHNFQFFLENPSNVILCFSVSFCIFFGSPENIKFIQEILQESDHKQQETAQEGEMHNLE
jgi:hypothetical protein